MVVINVFITVAKFIIFYPDTFSRIYDTGIGFLNWHNLCIFVSIYLHI